MAKKNGKQSLKTCEGIINEMSYEELQEYIAAPDTCYPEYLELAKDRLKELKTEKMRNTIIKMMAEIGYESEFDEDGYLDFSLNTDNPYYFHSYSEGEKSYFKDVCFSISFDYDLRYIEIIEHCWKKVKLDNVEEVERLKRAINDANSGCSVVIHYCVDEEEKVIEVNCLTNYPYLPYERYLKEFFDYKIIDILFVNALVNCYMEKEKKENVTPTNKAK